MTKDTGPAKPRPAPARVKKSETLEVRIPYETKQAFLSACREDGTTASEVVREKVQDYLDTREQPSVQPDKRTLIMRLPQPIRRYGWRAAAGGVAAIGLVGVAALPSAATPDFKAQFGRLDTNADGVLSVEEFLGAIDKDAKPETRKIVIESRVTASGEGAEGAEPKVSATGGMKEDAFTFWLPEELGGGAAATGAPGAQTAFTVISRNDVKTGDAQDGDTVSRTHSFSLEDIRKGEFDSIDTNKDGKVSLAEYQARQTATLTRGFEILDANGDKSLSEEEYARIVAPPMVRINVTGPGMPDMPVEPKIDIPGFKTASPEAIKAAFTRLDVNKDGRLSLQEYLPGS